MLYYLSLSALHCVTCAGMPLLQEKHRSAPAPLMTVAQYLQELQVMIRALTELVTSSLTDPTTTTTSTTTTTTTTATVTTANSSSSNNDNSMAAMRVQWLEQLEALQQCYERHQHVNPDKLISDWEVYSTGSTAATADQIQVQLRYLWFRYS